MPLSQAYISIDICNRLTEIVKKKTSETTAGFYNNPSIKVSINKIYVLPIILLIDTLIDGLL